MAYKNLFLCFLLLLFPKESLAQVDTANTLRWSKDYKLTWEDFQGVADSSSLGGAATVSGIQYKSLHKDDTSIVLKTYSLFYTKESWEKLQYRTKESLKHEQGHFDITELYARKLSKAFASYKYCKTTVENDLNDIFSYYFKQMNKCHEKYDNETANHRNVVKQKEWDKKIAQWLSEYPE